VQLRAIGEVYIHTRTVALVDEDSAIDRRKQLEPLQAQRHRIICGEDIQRCWVFGSSRWNGSLGMLSCLFGSATTTIINQPTVRLETPS
jgi:hypothetical protein